MFYMKTTTQKIVLSSLFAALTCVATMIIKIPSPLNGYLNLGDGIVLLSGWLFSPLYGFMAAAIGSGLADLLSGYAVYAPATFLIKGLMALVAYFTYKAFGEKLHDIPSRLMGGLLAETVMVGGYFVFEGFLYGFIPSAVNIPANAIQGVAGIVLGTVLIKFFEKSKVLK